MYILMDVDKKELNRYKKNSYSIIDPEDYKNFFKNLCGNRDNELNDSLEKILECIRTAKEQDGKIEQRKLLEAFMALNDEKRMYEVLLNANVFNDPSDINTVEFSLHEIDTVIKNIICVFFDYPEYKNYYNLIQLASKPLLQDLTTEQLILEKAIKTNTVSNLAFRENKRGFFEVQAKNVIPFSPMYTTPETYGKDYLVDRLIEITEFADELNDLVMSRENFKKYTQVTYFFENGKINNNKITSFPISNDSRFLWECYQHGIIEITDSPVIFNSLDSIGQITGSYTSLLDAVDKTAESCFKESRDFREYFLEGDYDEDYDKIDNVYVDIMETPFVDEEPQLRQCCIAIDNVKYLIPAYAQIMHDKTNVILSHKEMQECLDNILLSIDVKIEHSTFPWSEIVNIEVLGDELSISDLLKDNFPLVLDNLKELETEEEIEL